MPIKRFEQYKLPYDLRKKSHYGTRISQSAGVVSQGNSDNNNSLPRKTTQTHTGSLQHALDFVLPYDFPIRCAREGTVVAVRQDFPDLQSETAKQRYCIKVKQQLQKWQKATISETKIHDYLRTTKSKTKGKVNRKRSIQSLLLFLAKRLQENVSTVFTKGRCFNFLFHHNNNPHQNERPMMIISEASMNSILRSTANCIVIKHDDGTYGRYFHLQKHSVPINIVKPGTRVKTGDIIGRVGMSGFTTGPHLHFDVTDICKDDIVALEVSSKPYICTLAAFSTVNAKIECSKVTMCSPLHCDRELTPIESFQLKDAFVLVSRGKADFQQIAQRVQTAGGRGVIVGNMLDMGDVRHVMQRPSSKIKSRNSSEPKSDDKDSQTSSERSSVSSECTVENQAECDQSECNDQSKCKTRSKCNDQGDDFSCDIPVIMISRPDFIDLCKQVIQKNEIYHKDTSGSSLGGRDNKNNKRKEDR